jgi:hypothetical protein
MGNKSTTHINGPVYHTVYLGQAGIGDHLIIGSTGSVYPAQAGANGVVSDVTGGKITNMGMVTGGMGATNTFSGIGIDLQAEGRVTNLGTIVGGSGGTSDYKGGVGVELATGGVITNYGHIAGGFGGYQAYGGDGVQLAAGATLHNASAGSITGGAGDHGGGNGVLLNGSTLMNAGAVTGGAGTSNYFVGTSGGIGVLITGGNVQNTGTISGGTGGLSLGTSGGYGGVGVVLSGGDLKNTGTISGGAGGHGTPYGGNGGAGVAIYSGALTNAGIITGGLAGNDRHGGAGVVLQGGTLINTGTISGGSLGSNYSGDAVGFGSSAATLVVGAGAVFNGQVAGDGSNDTLVLAAGKHAGNLQGLGTQFTGITTIDEAAKANWTLTGGAILQSGQTLNVGGALTISGTASGGGTAAIDSGAKLTVDGALSVASVQFTGGTESLVLGSPTSVTSTLSGFGTGDTIDLVKLVANGEHFAHGTLTLLSGSMQVAQLTLAGNYTSNNFTLTSDGNGGTDIGFVAGAHAATAQDFGLSHHASGWLPHVPAESGGWLTAPPHVDDWIPLHHPMA